jgi:threonine/homoserine/homoserine lactone efflux protein
VRSAIAFAKLRVGCFGAVIQTLSPTLTGFGLGLALASAPGPVQAVLLTEAVRGGAGRGFQAMAGSCTTFGAQLLALALGVSAIAPRGPALRTLEVIGGGFLVWMAVDAFRARASGDGEGPARRDLPPLARGALAVVLNPGAWLFIATAGSSLLSAAAQAGGRVGAVLAALGLLAGTQLGDATLVLIGGFGIRRAGDRVGLWVRRGLAVLLAGLGLWLAARGLIG